MGAFFTNVQVHSGVGSATEVHAAIVDAIYQHARSEGYEEASSEMEADRTVLISPAQAVASPWIGVYDEVTESQDTNRLATLGQSLSRSTGVAVSVLVHDSDILELRLFRDGKQADAYNSAPDYWGAVSAARRKDLGGHALRWRDVLIDGATPSALRAVWANGAGSDAEDVLDGVARLVGFDPVLCATGLEYLERGDTDVDATNFTRLLLRSPAATTSILYRGGTPLFRRFGNTDRLDLSVGESLGRASLTVSNIAGGGKGLRITIWGTALDRGLLEVEAVRLIHRPSSRAPQNVREARPNATPSLAQAILRANLPDFPLSPGVHELIFAQVIGGPEGPNRDAAVASMLTVLLLGQARMIGAGELRMRPSCKLTERQIPRQQARHLPRKVTASPWSSSLVRLLLHPRVAAN